MSGFNQYTGIKRTFPPQHLYTLRHSTGSGPPTVRQDVLDGATEAKVSHLEGLGSVHSMNKEEMMELAVKDHFIYNMVLKTTPKSIQNESDTG